MKSSSDPSQQKSSEILLQSKDVIHTLEQEIASLTHELKDIEYRVRGVETQIQLRYSTEIHRIRELGTLYKKQKKGKKEQRAQQKKRGKNYPQVAGLKEIPAPTQTTPTNSSPNKVNLKKLYREAMLQVHPDKFSNDTSEMHLRSQELTIQLIDIYQSGNLDLLRHFHSYIMSGNAIIANSREKNLIEDQQATYKYLLKEKENLLKTLQKTKESWIYEILATNMDPAQFMDDLSSQFSLRIHQLERRTRINKGTKDNNT